MAFFDLFGKEVDEDNIKKQMLYMNRKTTDSKGKPIYNPVALSNKRIKELLKNPNETRTKDELRKFTLNDIRDSFIR